MTVILIGEDVWVGDVLFQSKREVFLVATWVSLHDNAGDCGFTFRWKR